MDFFSFGKGKTPLVILPGLSLVSIRKYEAAIKRDYSVFEDDFRVFVLDRSDKYYRTIGEMALDAEKIISDLALTDICVFGASQGGMIALELSSLCRHRIKKIAAGSSCIKVNGDRFAVIEKWISLAKERKAEELFLDFGEKLYPEKMFRAMKGLLKSTAASIPDEDIEKFIAQAEAAKNFDASEKAAKTDCPVLFINSEDDRVLGGGITEEIKAMFPGKGNFSYYIYDGYGHASFDTAPDYKERLFRFFSQ